MTHRCKSKQKRRKLEIRRKWKQRLKRKKKLLKEISQENSKPTNSNENTQN